MVASPTAVARARAQAARSSSIAQAARRFGDEVPERRRQWPIRATGLVVLGFLCFYIPWMFTHLATRLPWLAWPFAVASAFTAFSVTLSIVNSWSSRVTQPNPMTGQDVP